MPPHANEPFTIGQVEELGRVLIPLVQQALRPEFRKLREDMQAAMTGHEDKADERFGKLEGRVESLERLSWKALGVFSVVSALLSGAWVGVVELLKWGLSRH